MSKSLVTYNATSKEMRNNPEAFAERNDYVASLIWEKQIGENVNPGELLATIQWGNDSYESLYAPDECTGKKVKSLNRTIRYEELGDAPSQFLAQIS